MGSEQDRGQGTGEDRIRCRDEGTERYLTRTYTINGKAGPQKKVHPDKLAQMYNEGSITWKELQNLSIEWSTDASGRKLYYVCPKCHAPMRHCPDPACAEEGVGHHLLEEDWEGCDADIPYKTALVFYEPIGAEVGGSKSWMGTMDVIEKIHRELEEAIQGVLAKYDTSDYPEGCEFHGELIGLLQQKGHPETATGRYFRVGDGLPKGWIGPLPGKYRCQDQDSDKESSKETCSPGSQQASNLPSGGESTVDT